MAAPIYKTFLNRYTAAYYALSEEEKEKLTSGIDEILEQLGIKMVILCESGWDSEEWDFWGVTEYPSIETVQELRKWQDERQWFKYIEAKAVLGTKWEQ